MTALALLHQLHERGVRLTPSPEGTLHCRAAQGVLTRALLDAIRQHKPALLALLSQPRSAPEGAPASPSPPEAWTPQGHGRTDPPPYPGRPVGSPFRPG